MYHTDRVKMTSVFFKIVKKQNDGDDLGVEVQNDVVGNRFLTQK
jgi:hypothetical protein